MYKRPNNSIKRDYSLTLALIALLIALGFFALPTLEKALAPSAPASATVATFSPGEQTLPPWLKVYFTDPNPPDNLGHGIDQYVLSAIDSATQSIDVTSFEFNLPSLVNSLANASRRGVKVRVVYDGANGNLELNNAASGYKPFNTIEILAAAHVALVDGGRDAGLMHDKMVIVDGATLFVGSWNLAYNDTYRNNNNLLKISNPKLVANYQAKFNELFVAQRFGVKARVKIPNPSVLSDGISVETYMAPEDDVMAKLVQSVQGARKSIHYMIYTFTHPDLANALITQAKAGVQVEGVIEERYAPQGVLADLYCAKTAVKTDGNPYNLHHKVIIIDGETVVTGSFNFTKAADTTNDENVLVIHSPALAALYEQEYQKVAAIGQVPKASDIKCTH
jgi:phosphatidylserine/phosphatidylglycerophosphate/cardiolipin synthase-like enzyme